MKKFYLINVKTKKVYNKPFKRMKDGYKEIEIEKQHKKGYIVVEKIKGFENVICYPIKNFDNIIFINDLKDLKEV